MSELPEGWAEASVDELVGPTGLFDGPFGSNLKTADYTPQGVRVVRLENLANLRFIEERRTFVSHAKYRALKRHEVRCGDILFGSFVDDTVRVCQLPRLPGPAIAKADCYTIRPDTEVDASYLTLQLAAPQVRAALLEEIHGATRPRITTKQLRQVCVPICPRAEQRRIVEKAEALLASVKTTRERLAKVPAILKRFRQSVLAAACSGRLTEEWRSSRASESASELLRSAQQIRSRAVRRPPVVPFDRARFEVPEGWAIASLDELAVRLTSGSRGWSKYYRDDGFGTFVMAQNIRPLRFDPSFRQGVHPPPGDPEIERTRVARNDLLITIVGANTGDVCRVPVELKHHFVCQSVALVRPAVPQIAPYLELFLNSPAHGRRLFEEWIYGEGRPHLSFDQLRATPIALPPLTEQEEIARRAGALFALADAIELRIAAATTRADKLGQAILAKAFRGELVPTEAELARREGRDYEPASVLLDRIRAQRETEPPKRSRRKHSVNARQRGASSRAK